MSDILERLRREAPAWGFEDKYGGLFGFCEVTKPRMSMALQHEDDGWRGYVSMLAGGDKSTDFVGTCCTKDVYDDPVTAVKHAAAHAVIMSKHGVLALELAFRNIVWTFEDWLICGQLSPGHHIRVWPIEAGTETWETAEVQKIAWSGRLDVKHQNVYGQYKLVQPRVDAKSVVAELVYGGVQTASISSHVRLMKAARENADGTLKDKARKAFEDVSGEKAEAPKKRAPRRKTR